MIAWVCTIKLSHGGIDALLDSKDSRLCRPTGLGRRHPPRGQRGSAVGSIPQGPVLGPNSRERREPLGDERGRGGSGRATRLREPSVGSSNS